MVKYQYMIFQLFTFQVVRDGVEEICARLNISDSVEIEEYTLFLRTSMYWSWNLTKKALWSIMSDIYHVNPFIPEDDMMGVVFSRLKPEEYVLDVTADLQRNNSSYDLVFQRTVWYFPLRPTDNIMYNELMFFQSLPDYLEGLVVVLKDGRLSRRDEVCSASLLKTYCIWLCTCNSVRQI